VSGDRVRTTRTHAAGPPAREQRLAAAFVALADAPVDDDNVHSVPTVLTERCVDLLDVRAAGVLLSDRGGRVDVAAATSEDARLLGLFELRADDGPCLDSYRTGQPVHVGLTGGAGRWPRFASQARASGFRAVHALPLQHRRAVIGALILFSQESGEQLPTRAVLAQALADVAAIGILRERAVRSAEDLAAQLQTALDSRIVLEQAKGVIAERAGLAMDDAFAALRGAARRRQRRLSDLARDIVTGVADLEEMHARRGHRSPRQGEVRGRATAPGGRDTLRATPPPPGET
jgi:hypothetical protein